MKTESSIVSSSGIADAPNGPALFSFAGDSALIYFPATRQLARWHDNQLEPVALDITGGILAVRVIPGATEFALRNDAGVWIVGPGNTILQSLDHATGPVILLDGGVLFATPGALLLRRPNTADLRFDIDRIESLSWLGEQYVQIRTRGGSYALRIDPGQERLFALPEPAQ